jgi:hypothetical protein
MQMHVQNPGEVVVHLHLHLHLHDQMRNVAGELRE